MIQKAIDSADDQLNFHGKLKKFAVGKSLDVNDVKIVDEMDENAWAKLINGRTKHRMWDRWYGKTSYGRWNVVVYKLE